MPAGSKVGQAVPFSEPVVLSQRREVRFSPSIDVILGACAGANMETWPEKERIDETNRRRGGQT
jgi:hypothetical protein